MASSGGLRKRHSELQKSHYKAYRTVDKANLNLIKRLRVRIKRNLAEIKRKAKRTPPRIIKEDVGAVRALKLALK